MVCDARVDREVADRVLRDLEGVARVDRARELREGQPGVRAAADRDPLRSVVVADADLVVRVSGDPLTVVDRLWRRHRVELPRRAAVGRRRDVDVRERQARDVDVVEAGCILVRCNREIGVAAAGRKTGVVRLRHRRPGRRASCSGARRRWSGTRPCRCQRPFSELPKKRPAPSARIAGSAAMFEQAELPGQVVPVVSPSE